MKVIEKIHEAAAANDNRVLFSFEFFPPKTEDGVENLFERMERMVAHNPAFCDITWGAGGSTADLTLEIANRMQNMVCVESMMHLTCTNMPVEKIDHALTTIKANGIQNVLALRGDPPHGQDKFVQVEGGFACALDLVKHMRAQYGDYFGITVAGYPEGHPDIIQQDGLAPEEAYQSDLAYLKKKVDAGADLIVTQLFYDTDIFLKFVNDCRQIGITCPIVPGIMPINNYKGFIRMTGFCKTKIPSEIMEALEPIKDNEEAVRAYGVHLGTEMCKKILASGIRTLHLYTLNMEKSALGILANLGLIEESKISRSLPWRRPTNIFRVKEDVRPIFWANRPKSYISRTIGWDQYPHGRWGDSRNKNNGGMSENWSGRRWAFTAFLGIMLLHCFAIFLFTRGFLLTRTELSQYSQCNDVMESPCFPPPRGQNANGSCWTKPVVDRLVIIVLDAIRFDFVAPSTFFAEKKPWMDRLQVLHELASRNQSSARIFKAIADPPTTSLQRLKGLTTGGLPTFIDVGNSFGAPAILEDNLIHQLVQNGKRVVMMGDDTWVQLFPDHFATSYPFPSFNVKDLDTVDNGCITNLFPSLYKNDWDVLIAHFLGVDHAGHIFGVESAPMIEKLEQYNEVIEKVVGILENQSGPGGLHENTMLFVMGDHGQTLNGDHGGGSAEEVETAIFALTTKKPHSLVTAAESSSCQLDVHGRRVCTSSIQQLDFAATVSALLGLPFPFGSIGHVNSEIFSLAGGLWNHEESTTGEGQSGMLNYVNALCINSWQVKKYIDVYSSLSLIGFSEKDLLHVSELYSEAQELWSITSRNISGASVPLSLVKQQLDAYSKFLESVAALARSNWTEFNLTMMGIGFCIMLSSFYLHVFLIRRLDKLCGLHSFLSDYFKNFFGANLASIVILIRAWSFLSNSFILEEGRVASFLLATTAILQLRHAIMKSMMLLEALALCLLVPFLRISIELGQLKQAVNSLFLKVNISNMVGIDNDSELWMYVAEVLPMIALIIIAYLLYKSITSCSTRGILKYVVAGTLFNYTLIFLNWASDSSLLSPNHSLWRIKGNLIPQVIYAAGILQLSVLAVGQLIDRGRSSNFEQSTVVKALALMSAWSSTIILLSGKQGPLASLALLIGGWCIIRLMALEHNAKSDYFGSSLSYSLPVTQWSLLAVCLFFSTGHWCAFDGLRYAAAFIGFDEFSLIRQAILLTIDTFGFSHILPVFGLPLVARGYLMKQDKQVFSIRLCQVYLMYGLITAITATFTMLCVTMQRRHLMVWGLFAPKFVFDVVGLLLGDLLIFSSAVYYT